MRIKQIELFKYAELTDEAKEKARDWYRQINASDDFWPEYMLDDYLPTLAAVCGWRTSRKQICFSGFSSQGDGACFAGDWRASDVNVAKLLSDFGVNSSEMQDFVSIAERFAVLAAKYPDCSACARHSGRYSHSRSVDIAVGFEDSIYEMDDIARKSSEWDELKADAQDDTETFRELTRSLMDWFYSALAREYDFHNSDDMVAENIEANEYEFTSEGEIS